MKQIFGTIIILFVLSLVVQFFIYTVGEHNHIVQYGKYDDNMHYTGPEFVSEPITDLYDLEGYQVNTLWLTILGLCGLSVVYVISNRRDQRKSRSPLNALDRENEILKKQIENNELKQKLKGISPMDRESSEGGQIKSDTNNTPEEGPQPIDSKDSVGVLQKDSENTLKIKRKNL